MCLALPMRITAVDGARATIAVEGLEQECSLMLVPGAGVGDYVLVHAGYAISVLDETEAQADLRPPAGDRRVRRGRPGRRMPRTRGGPDAEPMSTA